MELDIFLVSRESTVESGRHFLRFYGRSSTGESVEVRISNFKPFFFVDQTADNLGPVYRVSETNLVAPSGLPARAVYFESPFDMIRVAKDLRMRKVSVYEDDVRPEDRFLMEKRVFSCMHISGEPIESDRLLFINPKVSPIDFEPQLSSLSLDIENNPRKGILYSIAGHFKMGDREEYHVSILGREEESLDEGVHVFRSEEEVLLDFLQWFRACDPDVIIGWNVIGFDLRFLWEKAQELGIDFQLGRNRKPHRIRERRRNEFFANISGRIILDGPQSLRASFIKFPRYSLEEISQRVLGKGKLIGPQSNKGAEIERLFVEDKRKLAKYNLLDCILVTQIFETLQLFRLIWMRSRLTGLGPEYVGVTTSAFDHFMLPYYHEKGYVASSVKDIKKPKRNEGGYVMRPKTGLYKDVIVLDFKSLYPSVIRTFNIDPISLKEADKNSVTTPSGIKFSTEKCPLPIFFDRLFSLRDEAKRVGDVPLSKAIKILMNSFYGAMGSDGCRFFKKELAEGIVKNANWILLESKGWFEREGYSVLYGDTDSLFVCLKDGESPERGFELASLLNEYWRERLQSAFGLQSCLEIEFEKYFLHYLLPIGRGGRSAKKRYAGLSVTKDGESLDFVGMESVRSDWTPLSKKFQAGLYMKVFKGEDYRSWIQQFVLDLLNGKLDSLLIYSKRLKRRIESYKVSPPQVKAARIIGQRSGVVRYMMTQSGPIPVSLSPENIDYKHYIQKQIKPIAEAILKVIGEDFDEILSGSKQGRLF